MLLITKPEYKVYLQKQLEKISPGSPAFNFILPATDGKLKSLREFRGNVVLVDFWFTGCSACKVLSDSLEKDVIPKFKEKPVSFISIGLDKDKDKWLKSLADGGYSAHGSINLFTEGLAFDHPLVKYYNIQGCPSLLLIDKYGFIVSVSPSRKAEDLIKELNKVLK